MTHQRPRLFPVNYNRSGGAVYGTYSTSRYELRTSSIKSPASRRVRESENCGSAKGNGFLVYIHVTHSDRARTSVERTMRETLRYPRQRRRAGTSSFPEGDDVLGDGNGEDEGVQTDQANRRLSQHLRE